MKRCAKCKVSKPFTDFYRNRHLKASKDGYAAYCKPCKNGLKKKHDANYVDRRDTKVKNLKSRYGMTPEQREAMLAAQGGGCAICGKTGKLVVDHCHTTKKVRGLLCHNCNVMLGNAHENVDTLRLAIAYLSKI